jgi:hypothetical protein
MLVDVILLCAPVVVAFPAVVGLLTSHVDVASKARLQKRLYATLLMAEKLPAGVLGADGIARDVDRQTLRVAYAAQYPQRDREVRHVALIGASVLVGVIAYYLAWRQDASLLALLIVLGVVAVAALWFERAWLNFGRNDGVAYELFEHFGAPTGLVRPRTELLAKAPALRVDDVFAHAADARDAHHGGSMSTLAAVNAVLAGAHVHFDWRREGGTLLHRIRHADYRGGVRRAVAWSFTYTAKAYDWLLRCLLGPFFTSRLAFLDWRERRRTAHAHRRGDVFEAAWLPAHYRNERTRLAAHWSQLHKARDPLLRWSRNGAASNSEPDRVPALR